MALPHVFRSTVGRFAHEHAKVSRAKSQPQREVINAVYLGADGKAMFCDVDRLSEMCLHKGLVT